jgi:hypothetical protein
VDTLSQATKQDLCDRTKTTCDGSCHNSVREMTCNIDTLRWSCKCNDENINLATYGFPISLNLCLIDHQNCAKNCEHLGKLNNGDQVCRQQCDSSFPCGSSEAPNDENNGAARKLEASDEAKHSPVSLSGAESMSSSMYALHAAIAGAVLLFGSGITIQ